MNSPALALVWESWRKNRWGFVVLLVLLILSSALSQIAVQLKAPDALLRQRFEAASQGRLALDQLLPKSNAGPRPMVQIRLDGETIQTGPVGPGDEVIWHGTLVNGTVPMLTLSLNGRFVQGEWPLQQLPSQLTFSVAGGTKRSVSLVTAHQWAEEFSRTALRAARWRDGALAWSITTLSFTGLALFAIFGLAEPHAVRGFTGLPPRRFALPVKTRDLVLVPMVFSSLVLTALLWAWFRWVLAPLNWDAPRLPEGYLILLLGASLALFQALVWGLPSFPKTRIVLLTGLMLGIVSGITFAIEGPAQREWYELNGIFRLAFALLWGGAVAAAYLGVSWERRGRWSNWKAPGWLAALSESAGTSDRIFPSPLRAQVWLEWRRNGRLPFILWTVLVAVVVGARSAFFGRPFLSDQVFVAGCFAAVAWLLVTSLNLAREASTRHLLLSSFAATRPVNDGELVAAKFILGGLLWLGALAILALSCGLYFLVDPESVRRLDGFEIGVLLLVSFHLFVGILPLCLTGRWPGFPWSLLPLLLVYGALGHGLAWLSDHQQYVESLMPVLFLLVTLKLAIAFWAFRRAILWRLGSIGLVVTCCAYWLVVAGSLVWWLGTSSNEIALIPAAALAVPLARLALCPLAVAINRHR